MIDPEKRTIFMPLTLDSANRRFFTEGSWMLGGGLVLLGGALNVLVIALYDGHKYIDFLGTIPFLVLGLIAVNWFWIFLLRKWVFKEKFFIRLYHDAKEYEVTTLRKFWGIYNIDGTRLMFVDGRIGTLIGMERGYKYGRPEGFEQQHFDCVTRFLRDFLRRGYSLKYYNRSVNDANLGPLADIERNISHMKGTGIYTVETAVIRYYRMVTTTLADSEQEYYLVTCSDIDRINALDEVCEGAMRILEDSMYIGMHRLDEHEVYQFLQQYYGLKYINVSDLIRDVFKRTNKRLVAIKDITYQDMLDLDLTSDEYDEKLGVDKERESAYAAGLPQPSEEDYAAFQALQEAQARAIEERKQRAREVALARRGIDIHKTSKRKVAKILKSISEEELIAIIDEMYKLDRGESEILNQWDDEQRLASEYLHTADITGAAPDLPVYGDDLTGVTGGYVEDPGVSSGMGSDVSGYDYSNQGAVNLSKVPEASGIDLTKSPELGDVSDFLNQAAQLEEVITSQQVGVPFDQMSITGAQQVVAGTPQYTINSETFVNPQQVVGESQDDYDYDISGFAMPGMDISSGEIKFSDEGK